MKGLLWVLALALALPAVLATVNLSHNETMNYTFPVNQTSEVFFCAAANVCSVQSLNISLLPGENRTVTNGTCSVQTSCAFVNATVVNSSQCVIDKELNAGEEYSNVGGACNVKIKVDDIPLQSELVRHRINVTLDYVPRENGTGHVIINDKTYEFTTTEQGIYVSYSTDVMCPTEFNFDAGGDAENLLHVCASFVPNLAKHLRTTLSYCEDSARSHVDDLRNASGTLQSCMKDVATAVAAQTAAEERMAVAVREGAAADERADAMEDKANFRFVHIAVLYFVLILMSVILTAVLVSTRKSRVR